jgi:hypothetical protein
MVQSFLLRLDRTLYRLIPSLFLYLANMLERTAYFSLFSTLYPHMIFIFLLQNKSDGSMRKQEITPSKIKRRQNLKQATRSRR